MLIDIDFLLISKGLAIATLTFGTLALLGFLFKWGIRFRLVGVTGFTGVLTAGVFALGLVPFTRTVIPGAVQYSTVYDSGATRAVIAVPPTISEDELEATLRQAASNLFSPGRLGGRDAQLSIRARTVLHPEEGLSQPLFLGEIKRSLMAREDENMTITLYDDQLAKLPQPDAEEVSEES